MANLEQSAFGDFEDIMRDMVAEWLREYGFSEQLVALETPRCLLSLGIMVVRRRNEIKTGKAFSWCHKETRNLVLLYWRDSDSRDLPPLTLSARMMHRLAASLDGTMRTYEQVAHTLGVSPGWLRRRHKRLLAALAKSAFGLNSMPVNGSA